MFLEIVGSSPDGAEPQFIFNFCGEVDLSYYYFNTWSATLKILPKVYSFFNVADHV